MKITLDTRLAANTHQIGEFDDNLLLLSKNALFPWFILVPATQEIEFHKLSSQHQSELQQHINAIAQFIEGHFSTDKINIATIGNIVSQCHIHIIGRRKADACWPNTVWGTDQFEPYRKDQVAAIKDHLSNALNTTFNAAPNHG